MPPKTRKAKAQPQIEEDFVEGPEYAISPEQIKIDTEYAITINPSDEHQYFRSSDRLKDFTNFWQTYIQNLQCDLVLHLEVSKLGRLHWHGLIKFPKQQNINNFYLNDIHNLTLRSMQLIKPITDSGKWQEYCQKSKHMFDVTIKTTDANIKRLSMAEQTAKANGIPLKVKTMDYFSQFPQAT